MDESVICPICGAKCIASPPVGTEDVMEYDCPRCGNYSITLEAKTNLKNAGISNQDRAKVAGYLRERTLRGDKRIRILSQQFPDREFDTPVVTIDEIIKDRFPHTISERFDCALKNLHRLSEHLGDKIWLDPNLDGPVVFAEHKDSFEFIMKALQEADWVRVDPVQGSDETVLTARGLNRIAEMERSIAGKDSRQAFVAMSFDSRLDKVWQDGFRKACDVLGYRSLRMDLKEHNEKICDAIIAELGRADSL